MDARPACDGWARLVVAAFIALAASIGLGTADFLGGRLSRRLPVAVVVTVTQLVGFLLLMIAGLIHGLPDRRLGTLLLFGSLAGVSLAVSATALYAALAAGTMSLVAPLTGLAAVVPIAVGLAGGEQLTLVQGVGMLVILLALPVAVQEPGAADHRTTSGLQLPTVGAAILGIGATFALVSKAAQSDPIWAAALSRGVSVAIVVPVAIALSRRHSKDATHGRSGSPRGWRDVFRLSAIGMIDVLAFLCFVVATTQGPLIVVALLASLYPLTTVALARAFLGERLSRSQWLAISAIFTGIVCTVAG